MPHQKSFWSPPPRTIARVTPAESMPAGTIGDTLVHHLHLEENRFAATALATDPGGDYWYWGVMASEDSPDVRIDADFMLPKVPQGRATLVIETHGLLAIGPESPVGTVLEINRETVEVVQFDSSGPTETTLEIPARFFREGKNTISLVSDGTQPAEKLAGVYIDAFDLAFPLASTSLDEFQGRAQLFGEDALCLFSEGTRAEVVSHKSAEPLWVSEEGCFSASPDEVLFVDGQNAGDEDAVVRPLRRTDAVLGNYLIVTPRSLFPAAERLRGLKDVEGYQTAILLLDEVLDTFAHGYRDPAAISKALTNNSSGILVILGDAHYDYQGRLGPRPLGVPAQMIPTPDGLFAADSTLADTDGDGVPNWQVGRLPFQTLEEAENYLNALEQYTLTRGEDLRLDALLFSGRIKNNHYGVANQRLRGALNPDWKTHLLARRKRSDPRADSAALVAHLQRGVRWAHYQGHGGMEHLDHTDYLSVETEMLGQTAFLSVAGCIAGRFEFPGFDSIADVLVRRGGALSVFAPSGLTPGSQTQVISRALAKALVEEEANAEDRAPRVGDVLQAVWRAGESGPRSEILQRYNLLGDPALRLFPARREALTEAPGEGAVPPSVAGAGNSGAEDGTGCRATRTGGDSAFFWLGVLLLVVGVAGFRNAGAPHRGV